MVKKLSIFGRAKKYFDQSKTVKKLGAGFEKIPSGLGKAGKKLVSKKIETWYGKTGKLTGASLLIAAQAITKSIKIIGVDNLVLRTAEIEFSKIKSNKKLAAFIRKHPFIPAYIVNAMFMAGVFFGGKATLDKIKSPVEKVVTITADQLPAYYKQMSIVVKPANVGLAIIPEGMLYKALYTSADGMWNLAGCITVIPVDKNNLMGKWRPVKEGDTCTPDEAIIWMGAFFDKFIYPILNNNLKVQVSTDMYIALADFAYNNKDPYNFDNQMIRALNDGKSEEDVLKMFSHYRGGDNAPTVRRGLLKRRWIEAFVAGGACNYTRLLDCHISGLTSINYTNFYTDDTNDKSKPYYKYDFSESLIEMFYNKTVAGGISIREEFMKSKAGREYIKKIETMPRTITLEVAEDKVRQEKIEKTKKSPKQYVLADQIKKLISDGELAHKQGDYDVAELKFMDALSLDDENYDAYNSLSFTLYKAKRYKDAIVAAQKCINLAHKFEKTGVVDDDVYAMAYYNAGISREALGEFEVALKNYKTASLRSPDNQIYKISIESVSKKIKEQENKKSTFNNAVKKVDKKQAVKKSSLKNNRQGRTER